VSGKDNGYSYNTARSSFFYFMIMQLIWGSNDFSIASNAFSYYNYKLESTFFDENKKDD
jgi:hypothetical protein